MDDYSAGRKAASYWFVDGLPEILYGLAFMVWGVIGALLATCLPKLAVFAIMIPVTFALVVTLTSRDENILDRIKARITYPRSGYAAPPENEDRGEASTPISLFGYPPPKTNVTAFRNRTVFLIFQTANIGATADDRWIPVIATTIIGGSLYWLGRGSERPYSLLSVAVLAAGGLALSLFASTQPTRPFLPAVWSGVWLMSLGLVHLRRYLHDNPLPHGANA
jgi:hypothetical protein